jgi:hypothetical protein
VLAALGQCEREDGGPPRELTPAERAVVRRQAVSVVIRSLLIAALAAAIAWVV